MPVDLMAYVQMFGKGFAIHMAPSIGKGVLLEILRAKKIDVAKAAKWVENNNSLWEGIDPKYKINLKKLAQKVGNLDWIDVNWAIASMTEEFPAVASLFLGWKKGRNWLGRQIEILKKEAMQ